MTDVQDLKTLFEQKVVENYRLFYSIAYERLENSHQAEEAVQESVLKAWRDIGTLDDPKALVGWVARITRNMALDMKKKRAPKASENEKLDTADGREAGAGLTGAGLAAAEQGDERLRLLGVIDGLPEHVAIVLCLRFFYDMDIAEIGQTMGLTANNVRVRLHRGIETLRNQPNVRQMWEAGVQ